ncbi:energy transducer TonB [Christiangramia portivictoriae]|uniref:energy transducer TonB n=1 Tax=Christiangramia portivictoriae TaxID=326069 RepID=UPI00040A018F|nr:energy transducer TonB [Christiangramia portivictoriae]
MKKILMISMLFIGLGAFAQNDVSVKGNKVSMKETAPVWPGCEEKEDTKACFNSMLMKHIKENYKYPKNEKGEYIRGKATVSLVVNEEGNVVVKEVSGKHPQINKEAKRMIEAIPQMTPGKMAGKPRAISYKIPLTF